MTGLERVSGIDSCFGPILLPGDSLAQRIGPPAWQRGHWNSGDLRKPRRGRRLVDLWNRLNPRTESEIACRFLIRSAPCHQTPDRATTTTAQELQNTNNIPMQPAAAIGPTMPGQADSTDQIKNRVLISHSVQTTPSSTKPPIHYNNTKTAEYQQPTSAADISHRADAAWQPKSADWIANRTPIPNPVRATHPATRSPTTKVPQEPRNTNNPQICQRPASIPPAP